MLSLQYPLWNPCRFLLHIACDIGSRSNSSSRFHQRINPPPWWISPFREWRQTIIVPVLRFCYIYLVGQVTFGQVNIMSLEWFHFKNCCFFFTSQKHAITLVCDVINCSLSDEGGPRTSPAAVSQHCSGQLHWRYLRPAADQSPPKTDHRLLNWPRFEGSQNSRWVYFRCAY